MARWSLRARMSGLLVAVSDRWGVESNGPGKTVPCEGDPHARPAQDTSA